MDLLQIVIALIVVGGLLYVLPKLPIHATIVLIIQTVAIIVLAIIVLKAVWPMTGLG